MLFANEINETKVIKVANEMASQMPTSHQNENETTPEMKHSPITDWNSVTWLCYLCEENFNGFENLSTHQESFHKDRNKEEDHFICFDCKETLSEYSIFLNHIRSRHYNSLKLCCDVCNKLLPDYAQLAEHREEHADEIHAAIYHCNLCEEVAATEKILKLHIQEYHDLKSSDAEQQKDPSDVFIIEELKFECPDDLKDESVLEDCIKCEEEYNDTEELFQCGQCVQNFKNEASLELHMETHNSEGPLKCDVCSKMFKRKCILDKHMLVHFNPFGFQCDICSKTWKSELKLKKHIEIHHSERPHKCDVCSKMFTTKYNLRLHMETHNNSERLKCDVCSKPFTNKSHLLIHMKIHNFKCDVCTKTFKQKNLLHMHLLVHNDQFAFKCGICSMGFKCDSYLKDHMITHNSELKCDVCSETFTKKSHLRNHLITHKVERPFKCDVCSKTFKINAMLHVIKCCPSFECRS